ncbi:BTB/POZ domain-containing protein KCTD16-like [Watersipora subatra]|uniref:BTB/POZ domain-containing protein KCTD16-like n=1 Tax=Watersipora subatra TaxID=2589382 RepID=UPI00355BBF49
MGPQDILEINVGGVCYTTTIETLTSAKDSLLASYFCEENSSSCKLGKDSSGRWFLDRDGILFRYILDYLRNRRLILPENFSEISRLKLEAEYYRLPEMCKILETRTKPGILPSLSTMKKSSSMHDIKDKTGTITIGYRGTFFFGRDGLADVKFRKLCRILVCGKVNLCRSVFRETLNETRDADRGDYDRYSARFYLKHNFLEQAFDMLMDAGFELKAACGTGTSSQPHDGTQQNLNMASIAIKGVPQVLNQESEEGRWYHYNEFVWTKSH